MFGALGATIGVGALVFGIVESAERGWTNPMVLIGAGQGLAFAPLTTFGIAAVRGEDAGAASGLVNTAHQLGMALGWPPSSPPPRTPRSWCPKSRWPLRGAPASWPSAW